MQRFSKSSKGISSQIIVLFLVLALFMYLFDTTSSTHLLLAILLFLISCITLFAGTLIGLVVTLGVLFVAGNLLVFMSMNLLSIQYLSLSVLTIEDFIFFGITLIFVVLIAGSIQNTIHHIIIEHKRIKEEIKQFVAIDQATSFDNLKRMEVEIKREMARVNRHGGNFMLLLVELDHYKEFIQVYGQKEMNHLLQSIGQKVNEILRSSDKKFRFQDNRFAFLLIETKQEFIETIIEKLANKIQTHQLLNGKTVTLTYHISFSEYNGQKQYKTYEDFLEGVESEIMFYAM